MRAYTGFLAQYLATKPRNVIAPDCFTFTLANGNQYFYTNADTDVSFYNYDTTDLTSGILSIGELNQMVLGHSGESPIAVFKANSVRVSGLKYTCKIGLDTDEQDVKISCVTPPKFLESDSAIDSGVLGTGELGHMDLGGGPFNSDAYGPSLELIEGMPFLEALATGVFDGAYLQREQAFLPAWGAIPYGTLIKFHGRITTIDKIGRTDAQIRVKNDLVVLDTDWPRNIYAATCPWILYGYGCNGDGRLAQSNWKVDGTVGGGSTQRTIFWTNPQSSAYFNEGIIKFTSGVLNNVTANIKESTATKIVVCDELTVAPQPGDTFHAFPGCDHTTGPAGCGKFNNLKYFGGYPNVPPPTSAI